MRNTTVQLGGQQTETGDRQTTFSPKLPVRVLQFIRRSTPHG
ncbi:hypothetical protein [Myxacorys almedinensis]|nr:hypothetical protein [Myxacorys almedinensis]